MELPQDLTKELQDILQGDFPLFQGAMGEKPHGGLRFNAQKAQDSPWGHLGMDDKVPWTELGFYSQEQDLARHPYHHGGIFYIQEPSAMAPAEILQPHSGQWVLDLCAAPGGKVTRLGEILGGTGFLVANDISNSRCRGLLRNIERFALANSVVTNETPERLQNHFGPIFHRVLVDAPCSGQGMFRKDPKLLKEYLNNSHRPYSQWQREILSAAAGLTAPGGEIVYSTCTFSRQENEGVIDWFLKTHPEFFPMEIPLTNGFAPGVENFPGTARLWPHIIKGEGHFLAHLKKKGQESLPATSRNKETNKTPGVFEDFLVVNGIQYPKATIKVHKNRLYLTAPGMPDCSGLKVISRGLYLGDIKGNRFVPSQPWALFLTKDQVTDPIIFDHNQREVEDYLKGLTLKAAAPKGHRLVLAGNYPLGWVKSDGQGTLKNLYPAPWRNI